MLIVVIVHYLGVHLPVSLVSRHRSCIPKWLRGQWFESDIGRYHEGSPLRNWETILITLTFQLRSNTSSTMRSFGRFLKFFILRNRKSLTQQSIHDEPGIAPESASRRSYNGIRTRPKLTEFNANDAQVSKRKAIHLRMQAHDASGKKRV